MCCVLWGKLDDDDTIGFVEEKEENDDDININWVTIDAMSNHMRLDQLPCKSSPYLSFDFRRDALLCSPVVYIYGKRKMTSDDDECVMYYGQFCILSQKRSPQTPPLMPLMTKP